VDILLEKKIPFLHGTIQRTLLILLTELTGLTALANTDEAITNLLVPVFTCLQRSWLGTVCCRLQ
jgi:hypothetical protein